MNKRFCLFVISFILFLSYPLSVYATTISELKEQKKQNEQKLSEVNETLSTLNEESKGITEEIEVLDDQLVEVIASVSLLEDEITQVEEKIATTQVELDEAIEKEETQYAAMKKRIQFMYEKGETSYVTLLLGASTISDVVNRAEYIEQLYEYDETLLIEYIDAKQAVEDKKQELELYQSELEMDKLALEEEKVVLDELLAEKFISGRECTVPVVLNEAMSVVEIRPPGGFYDYDAKYIYANGHTEYFCPPVRITAAEQKMVQDLAVKFYNEFGCRDLVRVDFIIGDDGVPYILEGNSLPGFTATSLVPKAAACMNISFERLCASLVMAHCRKNGE